MGEIVALCIGSMKSVYTTNWLDAVLVYAISRLCKEEDVL